MKRNQLFTDNTLHWVSIPRRRRKSENENGYPAFLLPDATGSSAVLKEQLSPLLNRPTYCIDDARLRNDQLNLKVDLDMLVNSYVHTILHTLTSEGFKVSTTPFIVIGYSGGGILANLIEKKFSERNIPNAFPVYIDSVALSAIQKMSTAAFAKHLKRVLVLISSKYNGCIKPIYSQLPPNFDKLSHLEQIEAISTLDYDILSRTEMGKPIDKLEAVKSFVRARKVLLANHIAYLTAEEQLKPIDECIFFKAEETVKQFQSVNLPEAPNYYLGYEGKDVTCIDLPNLSHFDMFKDKKASQIIANVINNELSDTIIGSQKSLASLKQQIESIDPPKAREHTHNPKEDKVSELLAQLKLLLKQKEDEPRETSETAAKLFTIFGIMRVLNGKCEKIVNSIEDEKLKPLAVQLFNLLQNSSPVESPSQSPKGERRNNSSNSFNFSLRESTGGILNEKYGAGAEHREDNEDTITSTLTNTSTL